VFGAAAAPLVVFGLSNVFGDNLRTALLLCSPPTFIGALILLKARDHLDEDSAKIFEAILAAMQEQQARQADAGAQSVAEPHPAEHPTDRPNELPKERPTTA